ncbi:MULTISPECIES: hypothetical protein [unclassified Mycobacterium]|uniref:hypothetical protein n=1 Tax=unclassified Mycobacterium TaxID=2642494 RepID=UPI0029C7BEEB|nr:MULTISPECIES: hypothetical protein [unclassified Mycobacterium]
MALGAATVLIATVVGCSHTPASPPTDSTPSTGDHSGSWPEKLKDFRFRWTAEPGVDLVGGWAVPVRAYLESWLVIRYTDDIDNGYPGFLQATPTPPRTGSPESLELPYEQRQIRKSRGASDFHDSNQRIVGNEEFHVVRTEPIPTGFRAFVCDSTLNAYTQAAGATQFTPMKLLNGLTPNDYDNMKVWRIEFSDHDPRADSSRPTAPTAPQRGPQPAPRTDVFGPWFVTGSEVVAGWSNGDHPGVVLGSPEDLELTRDAQDAENTMRQQCLDRYPLNADQRAKMATTVVDNPPTVEPAVPGWPES